MTRFVIKRPILPLLLASFLWTCGLSQAAAPEWRGYFKNFSVAYDYPPAPFLGPSDQVLYGTNNRFRIQFSWELIRGLSFATAYDLAPRIQDEILNQTDRTSLDLNRRDYRAYDLEYRLHPSAEDQPGNFALFQNLDRIFVEVRFDRFDLYVGRQAIAWGSARTVNPTDILTPFRYNELDVEDRVGVDAIRVRVPLGALSELDFGYVMGEEFRYENSAFFLRNRLYLGSTDFSWLVAGFRENLLAGLDLARSLKGAGIWLETGYVLSGALAEGTRKAEEDYLRLTAGLDYTLRDSTYLFAEYHFNGAGEGSPDDFLANLQTTAYQEGAVYLLARHYLAAGLSRPLTPLLTLSAESLVSLTDRSFFLVPSIEYNVSQNIYLSGGTYIGTGSGSEGSQPPFQLGSEFGSYPDLYFLSLRYYY